jgi:N,N'-diacetyllegionaminate synthase
MNKIVKVGNKYIGQNQPVFIVVELGVCHEQNIELAKSFIKKAKLAGADAVKIEAFQADTLVMGKDVIHKYGTVKGEIEENYYELLKRLELSWDEMKELKQYADELDILFFPTVHNKEDIEFFEQLDVCAYKISSLDMTHVPLIKELCKVNKPIFMDTGAAYLSEIDISVRIFEEEGFENLILMHNPSGYPAPAEKTDLKMIPMLQEVFDLPVGLSCHTPGFDMVVAATAIGANVIEKPITRDNNILSPEHIFAFLDVETDIYVSKIRTTEIALGSKRRSKISNNAHARAKRRGIYLKNSLKAGDIIKESDLKYMVPNKGIDSRYAFDIIGKKLKNDKEANEPLTFKDIE